MRQPRPPLAAVDAEPLEPLAARSAASAVAAPPTSVVDDHPDAPRLAVARRAAARPGAASRPPPASSRGDRGQLVRRPRAEEGERDVQVPGGTSRHGRARCSRLPGGERVDASSGGSWRAQKSRIRSSPATLAAELCRVCHGSVTSRRTRCSAATAARPRIVSRSPGKSRRARELARTARPRAGRRGRPASRPCRRPGPATPVTATATSAPSRARAPCAIAAATSAETAPCCCEQRPAGTPSCAAFDLVRVGDDRRRGRRRSTPGTSVSRAPTSPPVHDSAVAEREAARPQQVEHELGRRRPRRARRGSARSPSASAASSAAPRASAPGLDEAGRRGSRSRARRSSRRRRRRRRPAAASACATRRLRDAVEAQHAPLGSARPAPSSADSGSVSSTRGQSCLQLARRPGQRDRDARRRSRGRPPAPCRRARPDSRRPGSVACLRTPVGEVGVRAARAARPRGARAPRSRLRACSSTTSRPSRLPARAARSCGRRASGRARPRRRAGRRRALGPQRGLEIGRVVADDRDPRRGRSRAGAARPPGTGRSGRCRSPRTSSEPDATIAARGGLRRAPTGGRDDDHAGLQPGHVHELPAHRGSAGSPASRSAAHSPVPRIATRRSRPSAPSRRTRRPRSRSPARAVTCVEPRSAVTVEERRRRPVASRCGRRRAAAPARCRRSPSTREMTTTVSTAIAAERDEHDVRLDPPVAALRARGRAARRAARAPRRQTKRELYSST